ncbi:class I SAM-dependent methyltransferase [Actinophytocola gossypii]|uniref:class I SAM-dependent methyltransferase n=1 Tax=Actinophytocola gossypii TaxID=2812003 RepID=UPI0021A43A45|nr:class I SAM-dependent methyltransferase [Actinophytocola gossypii]
MTKLARWVHHKLGDPDQRNSFSSRRRSVRFAELMRRFPNLDAMRVLDLGGTPEFWRATPVQPKYVTTVNLDPKYDPEEPWLDHVVADACELSTLDKCPGDYDLVVSNSLIEHVGGYQRRRDFAEVVTSAAPAHWVQTPNRYFPVEPHYVAPGFQFLPVRTRARLVSRWPLAHERVYTVPDALAQVLTIDLVSTAELRHLFPGSDIWHERLAGLSKSIVAVRAG